MIKLSVTFPVEQYPLVRLDEDSDGSGFFIDVTSEEADRIWRAFDEWVAIQGFLWDKVKAAQNDQR